MKEVPIWYTVLLDKIIAVRNACTHEQLDWNTPNTFGYASALYMTGTITQAQRNMIDVFIHDATRRARNSLYEARK